MTRKADHVQISPALMHQEGCADCGADGRFEQEYSVPNMWVLVLLSRAAEANGATAFVRKQRGSSRDAVVKAHTAAALSATEADFCKVMPLLNLEIAASIDRLCAQHFKPVVPAKR